ncbi:MAG: DUF6054 family protein [[Eubacterium] siraeum]
MFQTDGRIFVSVTSTGGSQAVFFKINRIGENSFLTRYDRQTVTG